MSVSSHLTPEPERRLWLILENMRDAVDRADRRAAALTIFAVLELLLLHAVAPHGALRFLALAPLALSLPLGLFACSKLDDAPRWLTALHFLHESQHSADCLVLSDDIAKYTQLELIHRYDRYLGGGISDTRYYEDIVGQIVIAARIAARKDKLFKLACLLAGASQLGLFLVLMLE